MVAWSKGVKGKCPPCKNALLLVPSGCAASPASASKQAISGDRAPQPLRSAVRVIVSV